MVSDLFGHEVGHVFGHGVGNRSGAGHGGQSLPVITVIKRVKGIKPEMSLFASKFYSG